MNRMVRGTFWGVLFILLIVVSAQLFARGTKSRNLHFYHNEGVILVYKNEAVRFSVDNTDAAFLLKFLDANSICIKIFSGGKETIEIIEMGESKTITLAGCPREVIFSLKGLTENRAKIKVALGEKPGDKITNVINLQLHNNQGFVLPYRNEAVHFPVDNKEVFFLLEYLDSDSIRVKIFPGEKTETVETIVMHKPKTLTLKGIPREVIFSLKGLTENRAKIKVTLGKKTGGGGDSTTINPGPVNLKIVFDAEFIEKSFIELYLDGNQVKRGFIPRGTKARWEAREYIQIKVGNAGGLKATINGKEYRFGKSGEVANKVITWKKYPKSPNRYYIVVEDW
ncbi:MAG: DUF4115 domain-containing protein [bacterium]|nr:DUF4115 domain-containing protein [bacterium]